MTLRTAPIYLLGYQSTVGADGSIRAGGGEDQEASAVITGASASPGCR
jgi:hypothetical protein